MMTTTGETYADLMSDNTKVVFKGLLQKKNWYGNKQVRFFVLYNNGEIKYYKDMKDYKGSIQLGQGSQVRKTGRTTVNIFCIKKQKEYVLIQPDSNTVNFAKEKEMDRHSNVDDWVKALNQVVERLKTR